MYTAASNRNRDFSRPDFHDANRSVSEYLTDMDYSYVQFVSKTFVSNRSEKFELHSMAIVSRNFKYIFSKFTGGTSRQRPKPKQLLNYMAGEPVPALAIGSNSFKSFQIVWYRIGRNWKELEAIASFRSRFAGTRKKKRYWNPI